MTTLHHTAFRCRDIAAQENFYARHFGFRRTMTVHAGEPDEFFMMEVDGARLEFFPAERGTEETGGEQKVGFLHIALELAQVAPVVASVAREGIEPHLIIDLPHLAPDARIVFIKDPEGNVIELMEKR